MLIKEIRIEEIKKILEIIKCPLSAEQAGISCDLKTAFLATKDIRDKYVLSRLLWDLGVIDDFVDKL